MTNEKFRELLSKVFAKHMFMKDRNCHTINELLYCMRDDLELYDYNFNISIQRANGQFVCIPTIHAFVTVDVLGIWFNDNEVEYERENVDCGDASVTFDCITIYEKVTNS